MTIPVLPLPQSIELASGDVVLSGRVLGAQGNVLTEYMPNPAHVEYRVFPRIIALSEVLWTYDPDRDYHEFMERLTHYRNVLERDGVTYATAAFAQDNNK